MRNTVRIICLGDVVGRPGRLAMKRLCAGLRREQRADLVIANGENAAGGMGIDPATADELFGAGVDLMTLGDHTFQKRDIKRYLDDNAKRIIRPANFPPGAPGQGTLIHKLSDGTRIGVMNLMGRVFMNAVLDCPFAAADQLIEAEFKDCKIVLCDMHCEATSEKIAMGWYLDGRVSGVYGTHTHVQTADERILPKKTAYISDIGMCGSEHGVIGMSTEVALNRFLTGMPHAYEVAEGEGSLRGVLFEIAVPGGEAVSISRVAAH